MIEYGVMGGFKAPLPVGELISEGLSIKGYAVSQTVDFTDRRQQAVDYVTQRIVKHEFKPLVAATFSLNNYQAAFKALENRQKMGRIVITTD